MNGSHHFQLSLYILLISFLIFNSLNFTNFESYGFWFLLITIYLNPDADTKSNSSNNLGIFRYIFLPLKHRGLSHNPLLYIVIFAGLYYFGYVAQGLGILVSALTHIYSDKICTALKKVKRYLPMMIIILIVSIIVYVYLIK